MLPERRRVALHQAGHAVVQTLVSHGRYVVSQVCLDGPHGALWRGLPAHGAAALDREVMLGLYEFGLVTLAGIAAENRFLAMFPPEDEPLVALSDLAEWYDQAGRVLESDGRIRLVEINIMRKLQNWMDDAAIWQVVENLAEVLLDEGEVRGQRLQEIFLPLAKATDAGNYSVNG